MGDENYTSLTLEIMARSEAQRKNLSGATEYAEAALRSIESSRAGADGEQLRSSFLATQQDVYAFYTDLLIGMGEHARAFEVNERSRARSLVDMLASSNSVLHEGIAPALLDREGHTRALLSAKGARLLSLGATGGAQAEAKERGSHVGVGV